MTNSLAAKEEVFSRVHSIGYAPSEDGSLEKVHRVRGGRFGKWVFEQAKVANVVIGRGPVGHFRLSPAKVLTINLSGDIILFWGATDSSDSYQLDLIERWIAGNSKFRYTLTSRSVQVGFVQPQGVIFAEGTIYAALDESTDDLTDRDVYMPGPTKAVQESWPRARVLDDSYGGEP